MNHRELLSEYERQLTYQDFEKAKPLIAADAEFWFNDGSYRGIVEIGGAFRRTFDLIKDEKYWLTDVRWLQETESCATCIYQFNWTGVINGKACTGNGRGTTVTKKIEDRWMIIHEHLSRKPDASV